MALPQRNLLLRGLYGLSMIGMFAFLIWQSWLPFSEAAVVAQPQSDKPSQAKQLSVVKQQSSEEITVTNQPVWQSVFGISGLSRKVDLQSDVDQQIRDHWQALAESPLAGYIQADKPVYGIYRDYDSSTNTVILTLGIKAQVEGMPRIAVAEGRYKTYRDDTVLDVWQKTKDSYKDFLYQSDFERWQLDNNYQPVAVTAFLGLK
ncbi:hypothetical protein [Amphritea balenae]|uniref:AraC family transcriptional regulator n=1 Tax=Amphritea balenae TaxID=452629 RepID=A0A3P1SQ83_9GAMM|nr:hypothetical protein [Amphritea balenae]RRC99283.1 hypothetical protein EHS89_10575 [Amphritea balenae]GGK72415.1 hypothetical protein GCM10007941_23050 [Amphritea balenae]